MVKFPRSLLQMQTHAGTRWVLLGALSWMVLEIMLGLFGTLFLLRAGGGLLSAALWFLPLGPALAIVFLWGRKVFPRTGTRSFRMASAGGAVVVAVALILLGQTATLPPVTLTISFIWALTEGLHWSAFNLVEFHTVLAEERAHYFALLSRLGLVIALIVPLGAGWLVSQFADLTGYRLLFALVALVAVLVAVAAWRTPNHYPTRATQPVHHPLREPAWRWAALALALRGFWDFGGGGLVLPLLTLILLGTEERIGIYQAAQSLALFIGYSFSAHYLTRIRYDRLLLAGAIGVFAANVLFVSIMHPLVLLAVVPLIGVFGAAWGNSFFVANQMFIDTHGGEDPNTLIVGRELLLSLARVVTALIAIFFALVWGDGAVRPLMAVLMVAPLLSVWCLRRALGSTSASSTGDTSSLPKTAAS